MAAMAMVFHDACLVALALDFLGDGYLYTASVAKTWKAIAIRKNPACRTALRWAAASLPCLQFGRGCRCPWSTVAWSGDRLPPWATGAEFHTSPAGIAQLAAAAGLTDVLKWARTRGCPFDARVPAAAARGGHFETLRWLRTDAIVPWDRETAVAAARGGHIRTLEWALENGCAWRRRPGRGGRPSTDRTIAQEARLAGQKAVVSWLNARGYPVT
ncbi:unnamed protein product [Phaeothamnion confervicola]